MVGVLGITSSPVASKLVTSKASEPVKTVEASPNSSFMNSKIRIDNLLDIAILEIKSSDTGQVIQQFPTENQIKAFARAEELKQEQAAERLAEFRQTGAEIAAKFADNSNTIDSSVQISSPDVKTQEVYASQQSVSTSSNNPPNTNSVNFGD